MAGLCSTYPAVWTLLVILNFRASATPFTQDRNTRGEPGHATIINRNSDTPSFIPFNVSIIDATGEDMSHRVKVRHSHYTPNLPSSQPTLMASSPPPKSLQKRVFSRTIDQCPDDPQEGPADFIWYSFCLHGHYQEPAGTSAQAWYAECGSRNNDGYNAHGMCKSNEICVNGPQPPGQWTPPGYGIGVPRPKFARCVSHDYYVSLVQKGKEGARPSTVASGFQAEPGKQYGFEATLTTEDSSQVVEAQSLAIQPLRADGSPTAGDQKCSDCAEIDINYVPDGTSKITVHVGLKEAAGVVLLYLTSMLVSGVSESFSVPNNTSTS